MSHFCSGLTTLLEVNLVCVLQPRKTSTISVLQTVSTETLRIDLDPTKHESISYYTYSETARRKPRVGLRFDRYRGSKPRIFSAFGFCGAPRVPVFGFLRCGSCISGAAVALFFAVYCKQVPADHFYGAYGLDAHESYAGVTKSITRL